MANDKVTFAKGNTPLPADIIPGRLIVAEDTGDTYLDTELNKRIQLKDGTKVANVNGQVAGYLDVGGTTPNTMLGDNTGSVIAGSSLKSNSRGSFIGGNGSDIGTADKRASYILTTGQGNKLNASYTILSGMGLFANAGASVCVGSYSILDSNYSILNVASEYTKMKVSKNSITLIDCTADGFSSANEEASRVELTSDILNSWRTQGKMEQIAQYNRVAFAYGSSNNVSGNNNYVYGSYCTTSGQFNKQVNSSDSTVSGEFNITRRDNNIVIGDRNEGDSTGQMFEIFGTDSYSSGQGMLVGNHLIDKDRDTPKLVLGQCNAVATTPSYLVVGSGTTTDYLTVADIPDNSSKTVGVNGDINVNIQPGYPDLTIVEGNTPTAIPDDSYDKLYKVPTTDTTVYKLMVGFGFGGTGASHPNYPDWKKYSDWKLIGYVVKELPTVGEDGIIYYQSVDDSNTCIVCFYSNNSWHLNRIISLSSPFRVAVFQDIQRKNSLELHKDDVMQLSQFPEVGQSDAVPSPTKPSQLVNKKYVDEIKQQVGAGFTPQIVESLPTVGDPTVLYLVLKEGTAPQGNIYNEYLWIDGAYEHIGDTDTLMTVDNALSPTSENPVQNKVIYNALGKKLECTPITFTTLTNAEHIVELLTYIREHQAANTIGMYYLSTPVNFDHTISATDSTPEYSVRTTIAAVITALYVANGSIKINSIYSDGGMVTVGSNNAITAISPTTRIAFDYNESNSYRPVALGTMKKYTDDKVTNKLDVIPISLTSTTIEERRTEFLTTIRSHFTESNEIKFFFLKSPTSLKFELHYDADVGNPEYNLTATFAGLISVAYFASNGHMILQGFTMSVPYMTVDGSNNITLIAPASIPVIGYETTQTYRPVALDTMKLYVADAPDATCSQAINDYTFDFSKGQMLTANIDMSANTTLMFGLGSNANAKYVGRTISACITNKSTSAARTITFDSGTGITRVVGVEGGSADSLSVPALKTVKLNATLLKTASGFVVYIEYKQIN